LVDMEGRLLGINAAIISSNGGGSDGIGFAVPSNMVSAVIEHLEQDGEVRRGMLGVQISDNSPQLAQSLQLTTSNGALVTRVLPDSAAEAAGIEVYDVVTAIDDKVINSGRDLRNLVGLVRRGQPVELQIQRGDALLTLTAVIGGNNKQAASAAEAGGIPELMAGISLANAIDEEHPVGVQVVGLEPGSSAIQAGLQPGDIIIEVNRTPVITLQEFIRQANEADGFMALTVLRDQRPLLIMLS
ncbi:MAG: PDZ domain-containing protein, partial [Gammaproteobacteria bacterium]|nr:PDZ domain-containing protein [Gammaproteobacteria bacterium]